MPIVDLEVLEKKAKEKADAEKSPTTKLIGDKRVFLGDDDDWYDTPGEALNSLQIKRQQDEYKRLGLNELGQTKEQEELSKKRSALAKKKEEILKQAALIDIEIAQVGQPEKEEKEQKHKKK